MENWHAICCILGQKSAQKHLQSYVEFLCGSTTLNTSFCLNYYVSLHMYNVSYSNKTRTLFQFFMLLKISKFIFDMKNTCLT